MRQVFKKAVGLSLAAMMVSQLSITSFADAEFETTVRPDGAAGDIALTEANFPDTAFRSIVADTFDANYDGIISADEQDGTYLDADGMSYAANWTWITDIKGIELLTWVTELDLIYFIGDELDFSGNTSITDLTIAHAYHTNATDTLTIDLSNSKIDWLEDSYTYNTKYILGSNLTVAMFTNSGVKSIDFSNATKLDDLYIEECDDLTSLDLSKCSLLGIRDEENDIYNNIEIYNCKNLTNINFPVSAAHIFIESCPKLSALNISKLTDLQILSVISCGLTSLDISKAPKLSVLNCSYNSLTQLDTSNNPLLEELNVEYNQLSSLDISKLDELCYIYYGGNKFSSLDLGTNTEWVRGLGVSGLGLTSLDLSKYPNLEVLLCGNNKLTSLDLSKTPKLRKLICNNNQIKSLDLLPLEGLHWLNANYNQLTELTFYGKEYNDDDDILYPHILQISYNKIIVPDITPAIDTFYTYPTDMQIKFSALANEVVIGNVSTFDLGQYLPPNVIGLDVTGATIDEDGVLTDISDKVIIKYELDTNSRRRAFGTTVLLKKAPTTVGTPVITEGFKTSDYEYYVHFKDVPGATMYALYRAATLDGEKEEIAASVFNQLIDSETDNNAYYYFVEAYSTTLGKRVMSEGVKLYSNCPAQPYMYYAYVENGVVNLEWNAVDSATSYRVYRAESENGTKTQLKTVGTPKCVDNTAVPGKTYYYFIEAYNSKLGLASAYSMPEEVTIPVDIEAPTLKSVTQAKGSINISWNTVEDATSYKVYRATSATGTKTLIKTVGTTNCTDTTATFGTTYYYFVQAHNSTKGVTSAYSDYKTLKFTSIAPPTLNSVTATGNTVTLKWNSVPNATSYKIYRGTSATAAKTLIKTVGITSCTDSNVTAGNTYYYYVVAYSSKTGTMSAASNTKSVTIESSLSAPKLSSVTQANGKVNLAWNAVDGATSYKIYRSTSATGTKTLIKSVGITSCTDSDVSAGNTYYYHVVAYSSKTGAMSAASNTMSVKVTSSLSAPTISSVTQAKGQINISWNAVSGATSYKVYRATSATGAKTLIKSVGITSCTDTTATLGTTYYYFVQAYSSKTGAISAFSGYKSLKFTSLAPPTLNSVTKSGNVVTLSWSAVPGATSYKIFRGTSATGAKTLLKTVGITSCSNSSITAGTTYYYYVVAYSSKTGTMSAASNTKSITV